MPVIIISDIHDNMLNLEKCLSWSKVNNIEALFCCGDVTTAETLEYLATNFFGLIYLVRGNMEIYNEKEINKYSNIKYLGRYGSFVFGKNHVGMCHEDFNITRVTKSNDIVFYGHTHKPWVEKKDNREIINPGTLGGVFQKGTFAVWDNVKHSIKLKILDHLKV